MRKRIFSPSVVNSEGLYLNLSGVVGVAHPLEQTILQPLSATSVICVEILLREFFKGTQT
jgi:hypothetical protein